MKITGQLDNTTEQVQVASAIWLLGTVVEITCGHWSFSVRFIRMTDHIIRVVGPHDQTQITRSLA